MGDLQRTIIHFGFSINRTIFFFLNRLSLTYTNLFQLVYWIFSLLFGLLFGKKQFVVKMNTSRIVCGLWCENKNSWSKIEISSCCQELIYACFQLLCALKQSAYYHKSPNKLTKRLSQAETKWEISKFVCVMWENAADEIKSNASFS